MGFKNQTRWIILPFLAGCLLAATLAKQEFRRVGTVIGIDLGTTHSCMGVYRKGRVEIIPNGQGNKITPSWVAFTDTERLIGEAARNQSALNEERTIFDVRRLIGKKFDDPEVQRDIEMLPYKVVNRDGKPYIQVKVKDGEVKVFSPEEITSMILREMKETAESYLGKFIRDAVITVPVYFNDAQRQAIRDAGTIAGLNVARIISEPFAVANAYKLNKNHEEMNTLVFDLGGGSFDVSIVGLVSDVHEVLSTNGDPHFGGEDFDHRVMDYFIKLIKKRYNKDISKDKKALGKLRMACEKAKHALSSQHEVRVEIESLFDGIDFSEPLTRARFEELNTDLFQKTMESVNQALQDAHLNKSDIHEVLLIGGSTRIPKVQQLLKDFFDGKEPNKGINPDEAIAYGAAAFGAILSGEADFEPKDFFWRPFDLVNLGVETVGGVMIKVMPNMFLPSRNSHVFTTYRDNQTVVEIKVYAGASYLTKNCRELGRFELSGIIPAPRGVPQIEVTFKVDLNDTLHVTAEDKAAKKKQSITIMDDRRLFSYEEIMRKVKEAKELEEDERNAKQAYIYESITTIAKDRRLSDEEIERMVKQAEELEEQDRKAKQDYVYELPERSSMIGTMES